MEHSVPHVKTLGSPQYKGRTRAKGVAPEDQLDVYERVVDWSAVKQLRSVFETTHFSCDDVFDAILKGTGFGKEATYDELASGQEFARVLENEGGDRVTSIVYRDLTLPWPFT